MLTFLHVQLHAKNLSYRLILCRDTDNQSILQSDQLRAFQVITEKPDFPLTCCFRRAIWKAIAHHFWGKKKHINRLIFWQKPKKHCFRLILSFSPTMRIFLKHSAMLVFNLYDPLKKIIHSLFQEEKIQCLLLRFAKVTYPPITCSKSTH